LKVKEVKAVIELKVPCPEVVFSSVNPEIREPPTDRYTGKLKKDKGKVTFEFKAKDLVALRAAINAYIRWVRSICEIYDIYLKEGLK